MLSHRFTVAEIAGLLAHVMDDNAILNVLHSAATGVSSGELRRSLKEE